MKVEKVSDSTYDMIGGLLDQQIKEIKQVCLRTTEKKKEEAKSLGSANVVSCFLDILYNIIICLYTVIELLIKHPELFKSH